MEIRKIYLTVRIAVRRFWHLYAYCTENVWRDPRDVWYVKLLKVVNLSVKSFFDKNIQTLASSLTYTTLLAVIPILSLLLAIARGFGMRDVLIQSLYKGLPSQRAMLENSLDFVDRFLATLSKGVFVGIGVVFLLWTLVSMLRKIESVYNHGWNVRTADLSPHHRLHGNTSYHSHSSDLLRRLVDIFVKLRPGVD